MYKINSALGSLSPEQQRKVQKANLAVALASHNQSFAQVAEVFADRAGGNSLGDGFDSNNRRGQKANLLNEFAGRSSSGVPVERGSSLFIRRVADLEENDDRQDANHFKDAAGQNIEMSDSSPFQAIESDSNILGRDGLPQIEEEN